MSPHEMTITDPQIVKAEVVEYIGNVIDEAQQVALAVTDDTSCDRAINLGAAVKAKISWLKTKRKEIYEPLMRATEAVRDEYDRPLKLGAQIEKTLAAAVVDFRLKKRREEERLRLAAEAEARRQKEEADRKEREAAAERERIIKERQMREDAERHAAAEAERQRVAKEAAERKAAADKAQKEADERAAKLREEEEARLKNAQEAHDVGLADRSEAILQTQTPIAPMPAPLPTTAERDAQAVAAKKAEDDRLEQERKAAEAKATEEKLRQEEVERLRKMDEDAALAKQKAAEAEAVASQQITVARPDERTRSSVRWLYEIPNTEEFLKLALAVAERRAPPEYLGWDPERPEKFRASAIGKDVTRLKDQFSGEGIGIRTWPEEGMTFKADQGAA